MAFPFDFQPDPAVRAQALERLMRQRQLGYLGQLSGDKVLSPIGQRLVGESSQGMEADAQGQQAMAARAMQAQQFQRQQAADAANEKYRQAQLALAQQKLGLDRAEFGLKKQAQNTPKPAPTPNPDDLRKEFQGQQGVKDFRQIQAAYKKISNTSDTGAGDMSLIFGYMKLLDPNSTVREGEYATAANAGAVSDKLVSIYNKAISGEKLSGDVRKQFRDEATKVYEAQKAQYDEVSRPYVDLAKKRGLDPAEVVFGYQEQPAAPAPAATPAAPAAQRMQGKDGKWYVQTPAGWEAE